MTPEEISALFDRWREAYARRDSVALSNIYGDRCVVESPSFGTLIGRASIEKSFNDWFQAFPDEVSEFREHLITGHRVVQTATIQGTDTGGLLGQRPTLHQFRLFVVILSDVEDGFIVHQHRVYDINGLLLQLATGHDPLTATSNLYRAALATAQLEHEIKIAADIQRALLPVGRRSGVGFEVAAASSPCRAIGGDFFDYYDFPNGAFGFVLGDVAGKGPPAALLAAKLQGIFGAYSHSASTPFEILTRVNEELVRRSVESRFATALYGVLSDGRLTYSNGGHNPPFIVGDNGFRRLETGGLVLGLFPGASFAEETLELSAGDVLVVFSDGVTEALNADGVEFGEDRLLSAIASSRELPPGKLLEGILDAVHTFAVGAEQSDDLTALVVRYTGS